MFSRIVPAVSRRVARGLHTASSARPSRTISATAFASGLIGAGAILAYSQTLHAEKKDSGAKKPTVARPTFSPAGVKGGVERTFIAIKPDGTQRRLVSEIISRFERKGYKLVAIKATVPSKTLAEQHYADLSTRPFFDGLVNYMTSGAAPVIAMVWEGKDVIRQGRRLIGATNPLDAEPGSIRGDYCISVGRNIIHGSDSFESSEKEIALWFGKSEVFNWQFTDAEWVTADN
ncbi:nucleoside diphosphate kinase [Phlyctochytrium arcticum]|nr:nucleoside diphosphate kinase [Phlyctochytrium arcticum]